MAHMHQINFPNTIEGTHYENAKADPIFRGNGGVSPQQRRCIFQLIYPIRYMPESSLEQSLGIVETVYCKTDQNVLGEVMVSCQ